MKQRDHPLFWRYKSIKDRCLNPDRKDYAHYGGRGITICPQWRHNFDQFVKDVGVQPTSRHQLDRVDNDGNYEPSNVRWSTPSKNAANRLPNRKTDHYRGVEARPHTWRAAIGVDRTTVRIGTYVTAEEAAWMYDQWALCLFGDDAYTNFDYV